MHSRELRPSKIGRRSWTSCFVISTMVASICASAIGGVVSHITPVYASQYSTAVLADSPSDYWPADDGSGTVVAESGSVGSRNLTFNNALTWFGSGLVSGSNSAIQGACNTCQPAWLSGVPAVLPSTRSEEIWFLSPTGVAPNPQGLISVRQPDSGAGGCSEDHTDVLMEPNPAIRVDSLACGVSEFATDCHFGQNGIPNLLDKSPHVIDVTENNGTVSIYIDAQLCATGSSVNVAISSPDCVAVGATECTSQAFPLEQDSVVGQAALYTTALTPTQITNHFAAAGATTLPASQLYGNGSSASPQIPSCRVGDAVNCATGNFTETFDEMNIPGRGLPLDLRLTYNGLAASQSSPVGYGWSFSYGVRLVVNSSTNTATVVLGDGNNVPFSLSNGQYVASTWVIATLVKNGDGTYTYLEKRTQRQYVFSSTAQLTKEIDRNGYTTSISYNSSGQLAAVTDPAGRSFTLSYGSNGDLAGVGDPLSRTVYLAYDGAGNLLSITDVGNGVTTFTYDAGHNLLTIKDPRGGILTNMYDSQGRVISQVDPMSRKTTFSYVAGTTTITDPNGNVIRESFSNNEAVAITRGYGSAQQSTWNYTYDSNVLGMISAIDPNNHVSTFSRDPNGNLLSRTDALNRTSSFTYDSLNDLTSFTDPLNITTSLTYDSHGNVVNASRPLTGSGQIQIVSFTRGDGSHPGDVTAMTDPDGHTMSFSYDANGDLASLTDGLGNRTTYGYDSIGRQTTMVSPNGNVSGGNPSQNTTTYASDAFGGVTATTDSIGHTTAATYDADRNLSALTDADGNKTQYSYDLDNELTTVTRADGTTLINGYDGAGNETSQTDGNNNITHYAYDPLNRLVSFTDPLNRTTAYIYDGSGNLISLTNASNLMTSFSYDQANQLTNITYASSNTSNVAYTYDADGRRSTMTDGSGTTIYSYDSLNRLASVTNGAGQSLGYSYDLDGNLTTITYPNGKQVTRTFNAANELAAVKDWLNNVTSFGYNANGELVTESFPNTTTASYTYNAANELTQIVDSKSGTSFASFAYARDNAGLLTSTTPTGVNQVNETYTYTAVQQLASVNAASYKYDAGGNITQLNSVDSLIYDAADQLKSLTQNGSTTNYTFDAQGNRISVAPPSGATTTFTYDQANRLLQATVPAQPAAVAAGWFHNLAVRSDGTVWAWGRNSFGQLGNGTTNQSNVPIQVSNLSGATAVAGGAYHSVALKSDGTVWDWGYNGSGQLGNGTTTNSSTPVQVSTLSGVISVAAGCNFSLALKSDGSVWAWGENTYGQLGNGTTTNSSTPVKVSNLAGITAVAGGCDHGLALKSGGSVWAWGDNHNGQLGNGTTTNSTTPLQVSNLTSVAAISGGESHSLAAKGDGTAWAWGYNQNGQLGNGTTKQSTVPIQVSNLTGVKSVAGGGGHSLAFTSSGVVWAWGLNSYGQLGNGTTTNSSTPVQVSNLTKVAAISGGVDHSLASTTAGIASDWGNNQFGQLGNGTTSNSSTPVQVSNLSSVRSPVSASYGYNGDGLRMSKTVNNTSEAFTWDVASGIPLLIQDSGTQFVYGPNGVPIEQISSGTVTFLHQDQLGSTRLLTDASGNVAGTYTYGAYGSVTSHTGAASSALEFAGQYWDFETGLYYLRARYYDPATGQFVSRDPIAAISRQPYAFASDTPLNSTDLSGLDSYQFSFGVYAPPLGYGTPTPTALMSVIQNNPNQAFPFGLAGCPTVTAQDIGEQCDAGAVFGQHTAPVQLTAATPTSFTLVALNGHWEHAPGATITFSIYQQGPNLFFQVTATYENNNWFVGAIKKSFSWSVWELMSGNVSAMAYELANACAPSWGNNPAPPSFD